MRRKSISNPRHRKRAGSGPNASGNTRFAPKAPESICVKVLILLGFQNPLDRRNAPGGAKKKMLRSATTKELAGNSWASLTTISTR